MNKIKERVQTFKVDTNHEVKLATSLKALRDKINKLETDYNAIKGQNIELQSVNETLTEDLRTTSEKTELLRTTSETINAKLTEITETLENITAVLETHKNMIDKLQDI